MSNEAKKYKTKLLRFADPGTGSSSILTKIFQKMLFSVGFIRPREAGDEIINEGTQKWDKAVEDFLTDSRNSIPQNDKDKHSARGNMQKEIVANPNMSWKVFCKALRLLNVVKFDFIIVAKFEGDPTEYVFKEPVVLGSRIPYPKPLPADKGLISMKTITSGNYKFTKPEQNE